MKVLVSKILRKGKKSVRLLLSTGETAVVTSDEVPQIGDVFLETTSDDRPAIRPLLPSDPYPAILHF